MAGLPFFPPKCHQFTTWTLPGIVYLNSKYVTEIFRLENIAQDKNPEVYNLLWAYCVYSFTESAGFGVTSIIREFMILTDSIYLRQSVRPTRSEHNTET